MPKKCKGQKEYEQSLRMKLEENADSSRFWKCIRSIGLSKKGRARVNLDEVYDNQDEVKTGYDAVEVWRSYFKPLLGRETEQGESDGPRPTVGSGGSIGLE